MLYSLPLRALHGKETSETTYYRNEVTLYSSKSATADGRGDPGGLAPGHTSSGVPPSRLPPAPPLCRLVQLWRTSAPPWRGGWPFGQHLVGPRSHFSEQPSMIQSTTHHFSEGQVALWSHIGSLQVAASVAEAASHRATRYVPKCHSPLLCHLLMSWGLLCFMHTHTGWLMSHYIVHSPTDYLIKCELKSVHRYTVGDLSSEAIWEPCYITVVLGFFKKILSQPVVSN